MKKYTVYLIGWDFDTTQTIEAETAAKAKGQYIKNNLSIFLEGYPKNIFFNGLRCKIAK